MPIAPLGTDEVCKAYRPMVEGLAGLNSHLMTSCLDINRGWTTFLMHRLQEDLAHVHDLAKCTEPRDVFEVYLTFFTKAFSDYQHEFDHLATINGKGFEQTTCALQGTLDIMAYTKAPAE